MCLLAWLGKLATKSEGILIEKQPLASLLTTELLRKIECIHCELITWYSWSSRGKCMSYCGYYMISPILRAWTTGNICLLVRLLTSHVLQGPKAAWLSTWTSLEHRVGDAIWWKHDDSSFYPSVGTSIQCEVLHLRIVSIWKWLCWTKQWERDQEICESRGIFLFPWRRIHISILIWTRCRYFKLSLEGCQNGNTCHQTPRQESVTMVQFIRAFSIRHTISAVMLGIHVPPKMLLNRRSELQF